MATSTARRTLIADAVLHVLADAGSRGLTHRAVDAAAGLPKGSTSYYLPSRAALIDAAVARLAEADEDAVRDLEPGNLAAAMSRLMRDAITGDGRIRTLARYELSLEAARRPDIARALSAGAERLLDVLATRLAATFPQREAAARARDLLTFLDGILFAEVTRSLGEPRPQVELQASVDRMLRSVLMPDDR